MADVNRNGVLEFSEYVLFYSLLTKPQAALHISFRLFDSDGDGQIDKGIHSLFSPPLLFTFVLKQLLSDEFKAMLIDQWGDDVSELVVTNESLMTSFFGPDGRRKLSYNDFKRMLYVPPPLLFN